MIWLFYHIMCTLYKLSWHNNNGLFEPELCSLVATLQLRRKKREREKEKKNEQIVFTGLRVTQSMTESRRGVYAIGSFIELFDNMVHWAVLQSFCHTGEPALVVVAQLWILLSSADTFQDAVFQRSRFPVAGTAQKQLASDIGIELCLLKRTLKNMLLHLTELTCTLLLCQGQNSISVNDNNCHVKCYLERPIAFSNNGSLRKAFRDISLAVSLISPTMSPGIKVHR